MMKLCNLLNSLRCRARLTRPLWVGPLVIGAVMLLTACGVARGTAAAPTAAGPNVIPWLSVPGTPLAPVQPPLASSMCSAANLRNDGLYAGAYHGNATENLHLTNTGAVACYFPGPPQMEVTLTSGTHAAVSPADFAAQRVDLQPNQTVMVMFGSPIQCPTSNPPTDPVAQSVQVTFPGGGSLTVSGLQLDIQCGAPAILLFEAVASSVPVSSSPLSALQAMVTASATAVRGAIFTYTVTLTNPTAGAIALSPCPAYTEGMSDNAGNQGRATWLLNCQAAQQIPAGGSLTFAMQFVVPSSLSVGAVKLFWQLQVPDGPSAGGVVTVS